MHERNHASKKVLDEWACQRDRMPEGISSRFQRKPTKVRELRSEDIMVVQDDNYSFLIFSVALQGTGDRSKCSMDEVLGPAFIPSP